MFRELLIETIGNCNRRCPTCLRQSFPGKRSLEDRFGPTPVLATETVTRLIDEAAAMGFRGRLNLQYFNEPLMDKRLAFFCQYAKDKGVFSVIQFYSNADYLTEAKAAELDGLVDIIEFALYDNGPGGVPLSSGMAEKEALILSWFSKTKPRFSGGGHMVTHFSPLPVLQEAIDRARPMPCVFDAQERLIIDYRGEMMMCCDDISGVFNLGNVFDKSLEELWFSEKHQAMIRTLSVHGGREAYPYCRSCPRT